MVDLNLQTIPSKDPMKEKTKAYMAAIMDAEGCFSISKRETATGTIHYEPHIIFTANCKELGSYAVQHCGGSCTFHKSGKYLHWQLYGKQATRTFLTEIIPYLFEKKEQAQILLDYINLDGKPNPPLREEMFKRIKELKGRVCVTTETPNAFGTNKTDHAYLSGIFDGEGSISLHQSTRTSETKHYAKFVAVTNTCLPLLQLFKSSYGGTIREKKQPNKRCYEWNLRGNEEIEAFLLSVLPYSIVKRPRALLMLEFVRLQGERPDDRSALYEKFRKLITTKNAKAMIQSDLMGDHERVPAEMLTT